MQNPPSVTLAKVAAEPETPGVKPWNIPIPPCLVAELAVFRLEIWTAGSQRMSEGCRFDDSTCKAIMFHSKKEKNHEAML